MSSNSFWQSDDKKPASPKTKILTGSKLFRQILDNMIATEQALDGTTKSGLQLRDYQTDGIQAVLKALDDGLGCIGVSAPTGSGKTTMFTMLIPLIPLRGNANMVLIIVHNITLAKQAEDSIREHLPSFYTVGIEQGSRVPHRHDNIIVATWQTLQHLLRIRHYRPQEFKAIIVDEAHHAASSAYLKVLHYFNDQVEVENANDMLTNERRHGHRVPIIGFSATFARGDERKLSWIFNRVVYHLGVETLLEKQVLSKIVIKSAWSELQQLWTEMQKDDATDGSGRLIAGSKKAKKAVAKSGSSSQAFQGSFVKMWEITGTHEFNQKVVETYKKDARDRKSTLVFCANLRMVDDLTAKFEEAGIKATSVSSNTPQLKRMRTMEEFKTLKLSVLINCEVLTEGADMPSVDCIILAKPTSSQNVFSQMIGRGLRLSPATGKTACLILDLFGICSRFNLSVVPCLEPVEASRKRSRSEIEESE